MAVLLIFVARWFPLFNFKVSLCPTAHDDLEFEHPCDMNPLNPRFAKRLFGSLKETSLSLALPNSQAIAKALKPWESVAAVSSLFTDGVLTAKLLPPKGFLVSDALLSDAFAAVLSLDLPKGKETDGCTLREQKSFFLNGVLVVSFILKYYKVFH